MKQSLRWHGRMQEYARAGHAGTINVQALSRRVQGMQKLFAITECELELSVWLSRVLGPLILHLSAIALRSQMYTYYIRGAHMHRARTLASHARDEAGYRSNKL